MPKRNFLNVKEKKEFEKFARDSAVAQARAAGGSDLADAIEGLLDKKLIQAIRMESGEFQFRTTEMGRIVMDAVNDSGGIIDFNKEEKKEN